MISGYTIQYTITDEQVDQLLTLSKKMWWSTDRTKEELITMLHHCIPFVMVENQTQQLVGFARVLTDKVRYAYIFDLMAEESLHGKGIGKSIMNAIFNHHQLSSIKYFDLTCTPEMAGYYRKFGFSENMDCVIAMRCKIGTNTTPLAT